MNFLEKIENLRKKGLFSKAESLIREYIKKNGNDPTFLNLLGIVLADQYKFEEAINAYQEALSLNPNFALCLNNLALALKKLGNYEGAKKALERALELEPNFAEAMNNLANLYRELGDFKTAKTLYEKAYSLKPQMLETLVNLAIVTADLGDFNSAIQILIKLLSTNPYFQPARKILGTLLLRIGKFEEAEYNLRLAIVLNPKDASAYAYLGGLMIMIEPGYPKEAEELLKKALTLNPNLSEAFENLGVLYSILGKRKEALSAFEKAYILNPKNTRCIRQIISIKKNINKSDFYFLKLKELENKNLPLNQKLEVLYGLCEAYEKMKDDEKFFQYLLKANKLKRSTLSYSPEITKEMVDKRIEIFTSENIKKLWGWGFPSKIPVFIVGMPRSGTTLMESILDAHPEIYGAGELKLIRNVLKDGIWIEGIFFTGREDDKIPEKVLKAPEGFFEIGKRYVTSLRKLSPFSKRIIDKMPANAFHLGIIILSMPKAKIIHMRRHPLDTILSCFVQPFAEGHEFTYDLVELALYYNEYFRLMNHWRKVFKNKFLDVDYELLVLRPKEIIKKILDYLEVPFHEDCLNFYKKDRPVKTASLEQVKKPIYTTSIGKWKRFKKFFKPVLEVLSPEVKKECQRIENLIKAYL